MKLVLTKYLSTAEETEAASEVVLDVQGSFIRHILNYTGYNQ